MRLAPQPRRQAEESLIAEAVAAFDARADVARKALKAKSYSVRELNIGTAGGGAPRQMQFEIAAASRAAPFAIVAGHSQLPVVVIVRTRMQRIWSAWHS